MRKEELWDIVTPGFLRGKRALVRQRDIDLTYLNQIKQSTQIALIRLTKERYVCRGLSKYLLTSDG